MIAEEIFGSKAKIKMMRLFYDFPRQEFSLSGISKHLGNSTGTVYPPLTKLVEARVIISRKAGRSTLYRLNTKNFLIRKLFEIFDAEKNFLIKTAKNFVRKINKKGIVSIILFGSVARGEALARSDIDLLVIGNSKAKKNAEEIAAGYLEQDITISPLVYTKKEVTEMKRKYNSFILRVEEEGKVLFGKSLENIK